MQEEDEFQPGSIVRVKLKNFVTYTAAEFHLGPSLNMIIGPNGTGKSTLVCAICLGLGWASELLGRPKEPKEPKELASFVKNGSEEAEIEIELAAGQGMESNPVVRRMIRKPDNKSIFWINGRHVGKNAVSALCKQFSIQIDNLCQFLPQDRVTAFAEMTDVLRLKETLRAAAPKQMVEWHDQLKQLRSEERGLETEQQYKKGLLEGLEKQQNASRDDVERWHQREGLLQKSKCLKKAKPMIELVLFKKDCVQAKKDLQTARRELDQINADVEPVRQAQDEVEAYKIQIEQVMKLRKNRVDSIKSVADRLFANIGKGKDKVADYVSQVNGQANARRERERDIARITAEIQRLERQQQDQPVDYDAESFERRKAELGAQIRVANGRLVECESTYTALKNSVRELNQENRTVREQRARLDTQIGKQASVLSKLSQDTAKAWDWFQKNRDGLSLKGDVLGPPILECSIRDPQYADAVESQLRKGDLVAITCTNADDQKLLSNQFLGRDKMNLHDIYTRTSPKPLSAYRAPVAPSEMQDMGFEGYLIDYVQGPDAVLAMLCDNARLNRTAYASRPISDDQHAAVSSSHIQKWVSGRDVYQITTRREYGASSTAVTQLKKARFFVDQPANSEEKRQLEETIKRIQRESMELQGQIDKCKQEMGDLKQQIHAFKQEKDGVQAEQDQIKKAIAEWQALPRKIQFKQDERESFVAQVAQTSSDIRKIKAQSRQASLNVATTTIEYAVGIPSPLFAPSHAHHPAENRNSIAHFA
jgi:chromosome segregation ATPase